MTIPEMTPDELDTEDISDVRCLSRPMLLAVLFLAEAPADEIASCAIAYNAFDPGWDLGVHGMGSECPSHKGIRFSPQELDTVVRLARYLVTIERMTSPQEGMTA